MEAPTPLPEHLWLQKLVGEWEYQHECQMGPGQPPMQTSGRQSTRSLGGLWIIGEMTGESFGGGENQMVITIGYDPVEKRFVGSFIASVMTHLWPYRGALDLASRRLTLDSEGPSFSDDGTMAKYQDIIEIIDDDHHMLTSQYQGADGQWVRFMEGRYQRRKVAG